MPILFVIALSGLGISLGILFYSILTLSNQIQAGYGSIEAIQKTVILISLPIEMVLFVYFLLMLMKFFVSKCAKLELEDSH